MSNTFEIRGYSVGNLVKCALERIRPQSRDFYRASIKADLIQEGRSVVDRHAGNGTMLIVVLEPCSGCIGYCGACDEPEPDYDNQAKDYADDQLYADQPTPYDP